IADVRRTGCCPSVLTMSAWRTIALIQAALVIAALVALLLTPSHGLSRPFMFLWGLAAVLFGATSVVKGTISIGGRGGAGAKTYFGTRATVLGSAIAILGLLAIAAAAARWPTFSTP